MRKVCFALFIMCIFSSCQAQKKDTIASNPGSNVKDFMMPRFYTETKFLPPKALDLELVSGRLMVDVFFNDSSVIVGFNIRLLEIRDVSQDSVVVNFRHPSSLVVLPITQYPSVIQEFYRAIKNFIYNIDFTCTESNNIKKKSISTFIFAIRDE